MWVYTYIHIYSPGPHDSLPHVSPGLDLGSGPYLKPMPPRCQRLYSGPFWKSGCG
jgi:hypothetical protein